MSGHFRPFPYTSAPEKISPLEALLDQVSIHVKRGICSVHSEGVCFKNVKAYSYGISSLDEILGLLEEGNGLLPSA